MSRAPFELGMIFILPRSGRSLQGLELAQAHQFTGSRTHKKAAAAPPAHQGVDLAHQLPGDDDMSPLIHDRKPPPPTIVGLRSPMSSLTHNGIYFNDNGTGLGLSIVKGWGETQNI